MVRHIIVPLNGSEYAEKALELAKDLALSTGARLLTVILDCGHHSMGARLLEPQLEQVCACLRPIRQRLREGGFKAGPMPQWVSQQT